MGACYNLQKDGEEEISLGDPITNKSLPFKQTLIDEMWLDYKSIVDFIDNTLGLYGVIWDNATCAIEDDCEMNKKRAWN